MTTGNTSEDFTKTQQTGCGSAKVGLRSTRSWNGLDGRDKDNSYTTSKTIRNEPLFDWRFTGNPTMYKGTVSSCFGGFGENFATQALIDACTTRALKGVLGKYRQHDFSGAVFLGEAKESTKMITGSIMPVLKAYQAVKRGRFGRAVKILTVANKEQGRSFKVAKHPSSAWLSLRYGWIPMINDAYAYCEAMDVIASGKKSQTTLRSKNKSPIPQTATSLGAVRSGELSVQAILKTEIQMSVPDSLGFLNPASVAWELFPGSFILDWVYDLGSYLELYFGLPGGQDTRYIISVKQIAKARGPITRNGYIISNSDASFVTGIRFNRSVTVGVTVPRPAFKNPFNGSLSRVLDMVSLAVQLK